MIPLPVILVEFLFALGLALFGASVVAYVRLRREGNWPPARPAAPSGRRNGQRAAAEPAAPSRARIYVDMLLGLVIVLWAAASWASKGYHL